MTNEKLQEIRELEETLSFFITSDMDIDRKIKVLGDSFWRAHHAGYCDYMAGQRMAGVDDDQVEQHNRDWKYKKEVERLLELLTECKEEELEANWQKASDLFDRDNEAGYKAWLELSEQGHGHAMHSVGWCYRNGFGVEQNTEMAKEYYRRAIKVGYKSHSSLFFMLLDEDKFDEGIEVLLDGARHDFADCFELLASQCDLGKIFGGNLRVAAYLACRAFELNKKNGTQLGDFYLEGKFFPIVYPYAKYCFEQAGLTRAELDEFGLELPEKWDEIEPIEPHYPDFDLTLDTLEDAVDPVEILSKAQKLYFADEPDIEGAVPYVMQAMEAGYSHAMYYVFMMELDGLEEWIVKGAREYGDRDCIEALAFLCTDNARYVMGDKNLDSAIYYWNMRTKLHGGVAHDDMVDGYHKRFADRIKRMIQMNLLDERKGEIDPDGNAILLRTDGSYEKVQVDFSTLDGIHEAIDCDRINIISTSQLRNISEMLSLRIVMYCDERGMLKGLDENPVAAQLSGYDVLWGDVIICGFDKDIAPLYADELEELCEYLDR